MLFIGVKKTHLGSVAILALGSAWLGCGAQPELTSWRHGVGSPRGDACCGAPCVCVCCAATGIPHLGLHQAGRALRGRTHPRKAKQLRNLDVAFAYARHAMEQGRAVWFRDLRLRLGSMGGMAAEDLSAGYCTCCDTLSAPTSAISAASLTASAPSAAFPVSSSVTMVLVSNSSAPAATFSTAASAVTSTTALTASAPSTTFPYGTG